MKKCMEIRVECRRPVERPRRTWLESVEADTAELEIDKEDVHDRKKRRGHVMKRDIMTFVWVLDCFCLSCKMVKMKIRGFHLTVTICGCNFTSIYNPPSSHY